MIRKYYLVFLFLILTGCEQGGCQSLLGSSSQKVGSLAPDFTLPVHGAFGKTFNLSEYSKDQPILLNFWTTWCPSCIAEIPKLNQITQNSKLGNLQVLGINIQESDQTIRQFLTKKKVNFSILMDTQGEVADLYGVAATPTIILLAKGGKILYYGFSLPSNIERYFI